jgi:hypothetical protein
MRGIVGMKKKREEIRFFLGNREGWTVLLYE